MRRSSMTRTSASLRRNCSAAEKACPPRTTPATRQTKRWSWLFLPELIRCLWTLLGLPSPCRRPLPHSLFLSCVSEWTRGDTAEPWAAHPADKFVPAISAQNVVPRSHQGLVAACCRVVRRTSVSIVTERPFFLSQQAKLYCVCRTEWDEKSFMLNCERSATAMGGLGCSTRLNTAIDTMRQVWGVVPWAVRRGRSE